MGTMKDLTGKRFGRLIVLGRAKNPWHIFPSGKRASMWECKCDCGNVTDVMSWYLNNGDTQSCGCLNAEINAQRGRDMWTKHNDYDLSGDFGIGYTEKGEAFWFDLEDYDLIKDYCWNYNSNGYVVSTYIGDDNKRHSLKLHRLVMHVQDSSRPIIDHKIHPTGKKKKIDNRKQNLRVASDSNNCMNQGLRRNNTSGVTGVTWNKSKGIWEANISKNYTFHYLGSFTNFDDAVKARKEAEKKYFGEFAYDFSQGINKEEQDNEQITTDDIRNSEMGRPA